VEAVVLGERQQRPIVDDVSLLILAGHGRLHAIVEELDRHAADRREGLHVTAQQCLQVLVHHEAREDVPRVAQHQ
jgi:hypothetical protein